MKLTYWVAENLNDSSCYNIREKTKRAAVAAVAGRWNPEDYGPVKKVSVEYKDSFDLLTNCLSEGNSYWEE